MPKYQIEWRNSTTEITASTVGIQESTVGYWFECVRYRAHFSNCEYVSARNLILNPPGVRTNARVDMPSSSGAYAPMPGVDWGGNFSGADTNPGSVYSVGSAIGQGFQCGVQLYGYPTRKNGVAFRTPCCQTPGPQYFEWRTTTQYCVIANGVNLGCQLAVAPVVTLIIPSCPSGYIWDSECDACIPECASEILASLRSIKNRLLAL